MPQISPPQTPAQPAFQLIPSPSLHLFALFFTLFVWPAVTLAEVRVVTAQGEYRMGDRDTREDAIRLATEAAKRNALEQVAVYLESITIVDGVDITKDEIRTYTAGLVLVLEQKTDTTLDGNTIVVRTNLVAQIDTENVREAIAALRENEDARHQLVALQQENDQLQRDLEAANEALAKASTTEETQQAAQQRQDILNRVQSNAMVSQAWTDWVLVSPYGYSSSSLAGLAQLLALLNVAQDLYPSSPHVHVAQQVITTRQPPAPLQPPAPPAPGTGQPTLPRYRIMPAPGSPTGVPRTLNEFTYGTPTAPPHIGNQPGGIHQMPPSTGSGAFTDGRQLNPFPQPSHAAGVPPTGQRHLPPTMNRIHPPSLHQMPQVPNHNNAPRGSGGGGHSGVGHGGGGGGGGQRGGGHGR